MVPKCEPSYDTGLWIDSKFNNTICSLQMDMSFGVRKCQLVHIGPISTNIDEMISQEHTSRKTGSWGRYESIEENIPVANRDGVIISLYSVRFNLVFAFIGNGQPYHWVRKFTHHLINCIMTEDELWNYATRLSDDEIIWGVLSLGEKAQRSSPTVSRTTE